MKRNLKMVGAVCQVDPADQTYNIETIANICGAICQQAGVGPVQGSLMMVTAACRILIAACETAGKGEDPDEFDKEFHVMATDAIKLARMMQVLSKHQEETAPEGETLQ